MNPSDVLFAQGPRHLKENEMAAAGFFADFSQQRPGRGLNELSSIEKTFPTNAISASRAIKASGGRSQERAIAAGDRKIAVPRIGRVVAMLGFTAPNVSS